MVETTSTIATATTTSSITLEQAQQHKSENDFKYDDNNPLQPFLFAIKAPESICIERNIPGVFPETQLSKHKLSNDKLILIKKKIEEYNTSYSKLEIPNNLNFNIGLEQGTELIRSLEWFLNDQDKNG